MLYTFDKLMAMPPEELDWQLAYNKRILERADELCKKYSWYRKCATDFSFDGFMSLDAANEIIDRFTPIMTKFIGLRRTIIDYVDFLEMHLVPYAKADAEGRKAMEEFDDDFGFDPIWKRATFMDDLAFINSYNQMEEIYEAGWDLPLRQLSEEEIRHIRAPYVLQE